MAIKYVVAAVAIGIGATMLMDLWNLFLKRAFGFGVASSKARSPTQARLKSLATHTVFGLALYVCALAASYAR
jgi:hypothetical protein